MCKLVKMKNVKSLALLLIPLLFNAQSGETSKWFFGNKAALDFASGSPTPLSGSAMYTGGGSASIADVNGNLLFYTNGANIWNSQDQIMANGSGLSGSQFYHQ